MKRSWVLLILPIVVALPANENTRFKNGSLPVVVPKRTTLDEILKAYNLQNLDTPPSSRQKREDCPAECLQKKLRENTIDLIVSDINDGNYTAAKLRFLEINDQALTYPILDKMTSKPNYENFLKFVKELPWLLHRMIAYEAMVKKDNLGYSIFTLEVDFNELAGASHEPSVLRESQHIIDFVRKNLNELINLKIAAMIGDILTKQPKDYSDMIHYSKEQQKTFNARLDGLVKKVYENTEYDVDVVEHILVFSNALTQIGQSGQVYVKLFKLMEEAKEFAFPVFLKISFKVKELTLMKNYKNTDEGIKKGMDELKERMPAIVRSIIWGQVCIKHEKMGAFLHSSEPYDGKRRNIILSKEHDRWEFQSNDDAVTFQIRNAKTNEYLYAENDLIAYSAFKRRIFTWRKDSSELINQLWLLEDLKWRQGKFFIKNTIRNEYLNGEELPEQNATSDSIVPELDAISKKDVELAGQIQELLASRAKLGRLQAFTWRRRSKGNQPEWILVDSSEC